ncbi:MAG: DNA translocase FtsK [Chlorobi bacterium]|nr:DNA translocase FtsK [Chlorobiota bacterium]
MAKTKRKSTKSKKTSVNKKIQTKLNDRKFRTWWGMFFILLSVLFLVSFSSFLKTWEQDQDILDLGWFDYIFNTSVNTENTVGKVGLFFSDIFVYRWFGLASYIFVIVFFVFGLKLLHYYKRSFLNLLKNSLFLILWLSVSISLIFGNQNPILGGKFGYGIHIWLKSFLGIVGESSLMIVTGIGFLMLTVEGFNSKLKLIVDKIIERVNIKDFRFTKFNTENARVNKEQDTIFEDDNNFKSEKREKADKKNIHNRDDKSIIFDLNEDDGKGKIKVTEKRNYKLTDDGREIENDYGFEVEHTKSVDNENITGDKPENIKEYIEKEFDKIEVGELALDVTANKDIISQKISDKPNVNYDPTLDLENFTLPPIDLLEDHKAGNPEVTKEELLNNKNRIVETLKQYKIEIVKIKATIGPTLTLYEIVPAPGVRISKIKNLEDDIALSLAAHGIRIIAPMPGRGTVGIEVPNEKPDIVSFKSVIKSAAFQESKMELPIALGKTISNESFVFDLAKMPHILVAGATGQGKSVGLNAMIASLLYKKHPAQLKLVMVDPKKVELTMYERLENHYLATLPDAEEPIITDNQKVIHTVNSLNIEMDNRYQLLKKAKCKNIKEYNKKFVSRQLNPEKGHKYMPYIVLVIDEFADLIMTAGKEIELPIARLAQLARAVGIHLIVATQRPSTNIITGTIKANFPARVAFRVASMIDSRTILDSPGANRLIGRGDMLITQGSDLIRLQCAFIDTPELEKITEYIEHQQSYGMPFLLPEPETDDEDIPGAVDLGHRDELFEDAARIIVMNQQGSTSLVQRKLSIGYNRAGRIIDQLEAAGIVGPSKGSKVRDVFITDEYSLKDLLNSLP